MKKVLHDADDAARTFQPLANDNALTGYNVTLPAGEAVELLMRHTI